MNLAIAGLIAVLGGLVGSRLGLPQGALLGALVAVAAVNVSGVFEVNQLPQPVIFAMYAVIGIELGSKVNRTTLSAIADAWVPAVTFVLAITAVSVLLALALTKFFGMDLTTSLFGSSPGAISGIAAMSSTVGANVPVVVAMHTLRVTFIVIAIPWIHRLLTR